MRTEMNKTIELAFAHSILLAGACIGIGIFVVAGWMPLIEPSMGPEELSALFEKDRLRIMVGVTIYGVGGIFWWTFACTVATQMKRIEGVHYPLTRLQVVSSSGTALTIMFGTYLILAMCYRPNIEPTTLQLMSDFWWLTFVGIYGPGLVQNVAIGLCIVTDPNDVKIYPRWLGFLNFWVAFLFVPGIYIAFFHDGPFAWDGILGFWVIAVGFFGWVFAMWWATVRAIKNA